MNHPSKPDDAREELVRQLVATGADDRTAFAHVYRLTRTKLFGRHCQS